jgi:hypothetical protein
VQLVWYGILYPHYYIIKTQRGCLTRKFCLMFRDTYRCHLQGPIIGHETLVRNCHYLLHNNGPGSLVGIATGYGLDGLGIEFRRVARFFALVQTGPGAHPASCTMGIGSFPGVKRPGRGADYSPPSSAEVENEQSYISTPEPFVACYRVTFTFTVY